MSEQEMIVDRMGLLDAAGFTLLGKREPTEEVPWKVLRPAVEAATQFLKREGYKVFKISGHPNTQFRVSWGDGLSKPAFRPAPRRMVPGIGEVVSVSHSVSVVVGGYPGGRRGGW